LVYSVQNLHWDKFSSKKLMERINKSGDAKGSWRHF
jgi:hypothetical protein